MYNSFPRSISALYTLNDRVTPCQAIYYLVIIALQAGDATEGSSQADTMPLY